jgi:hypothetical protein
MTETREVKEVTFSRRPDLKYFVRALTAIEDHELYKRVKPLREVDAQAIMAEQLAAYACDEHGTPTFSDCAAALEFMRNTRTAIVTKIVTVGSDFQQLDDEEEQGDTLKN